MEHRIATTAVAAVVFACLVVSETCRANPYVDPTPRRIRSATDIEEALTDTMQGRAAMRFGDDLEMLWDGRRDLLEQAARGSNLTLAGDAMLGLAAIGDNQAAEFLGGVLADTTLPFQHRLNAATALGRMGDASRLGLLRDLREEARGHGRVYVGVAELALQRAERPDRMRPLIVLGHSFLEFRFLLDDIAAIYVLRNPRTFVSSGVIYAEDPSHQGSRHDFPRDEYRRICDLLQDGEIYRPHMVGYDEYLIFELKDGRQMAITRYGSTFWAHDSDVGDWGRPWFSVRSESLAQYLDRARRAVKEAPPGSESPN